MHSLSVREIRDVSFRYDSIVAESMRDVTWSIEENDAHIVLNCHYRSSVSPCRAISAASKRQMMLLDGHLAERYSAYNTKYVFSCVMLFFTLKKYTSFDQY